MFNLNASRVGDSPILGAGLYVEGAVGAVGSTGRGEANLFVFLLAEQMHRGQPNFNVNFYIVNSKGDYAGVALYPSDYVICTEAGPRKPAAEALFAGKPRD